MSDNLIKQLRARIEAQSAKIEALLATASRLQATIDVQAAENARLREVLSEAIYEATHLSTRRKDGSHWAWMSGVWLARARAALSAAPETEARDG